MEIKLSLSKRAFEKKEKKEKKNFIFKLYPKMRFSIFFYSQKKYFLRFFITCTDFYFAQLFLCIKNTF
jgi:hypothetical protein